MKKSTIMKNKKLLNINVMLELVLIAAMLVTIISGCSSDTETGERQDPGKLSVNQDEYKRDSGENGDETDEGGSSEEAGNTLTLSETYDVVRNGVRLVMNYDKKSNSFKGIVENTTGNTLTQVRVEVHLSNGTELGPTTLVDLAPGEKVDVILPAISKAFDGWIPHAEVGGGEHDGETDEGGSESSGEDSEFSGVHGGSGD